MIAAVVKHAQAAIFALADDAVPRISCGRINLISFLTINLNIKEMVKNLEFAIVSSIKLTRVPG